MLLMAKNWMQIPPGKPSVTGDMSCLMKLDSPIHPFAFRTHAHSLGSVITGYRYRADTDEYTEIAKGSPQWPQAFYPTKEDFEIKSGDYLVARDAAIQCCRDIYTTIQGDTSGCDESPIDFKTIGPLWLAKTELLF